MDTTNYWTRRMYNRSRRRFLARGSAVAVGAAGLVVVGCGDDDDDDDNGNGDPTTGPTSATGTETPAGDPAPTGTVTVTMAGLGTQNYDPARDQNSAEVIVNGHVGDGLVIMGPEKNVYIPALASGWEPTPDGLSWIFPLREGPTFHDGSPVTVEDAKFSIDRFTDPESEPVSGARLMNILDNVEATDTEVILHLTQPFALLIEALAPCQITPQAAVEAAGDAFADNPIAAGPFKFVSARRDDRVELEAFTEHYRKVPGYQNLILQSVPDVTTRLASLQAGDSDVMLKPSGPAIPTIEGDDNLHLNIQGSTSMNGIVFADLVVEDTYADSPWADQRMREAVAHAIDHQAIVDNLYFGHAVPVAVPWAVPGLPGVPDLQVREYNPQRARELIGEAGHEGMSFDIYTYNSGAMAGNVDCAEALGTFLGDVGFDVSVRPLEYASYLAEQRNKTWAGTGALMVSVQGGRAAENFLPSLSREASTPYYFNPEFEAIAEEIMITSDEEERLALVSELAEKLHAELANVPLVSQSYLQGLGPRIASWVPHVRSGFELGMENIVLA